MAADRYPHAIAEILDLRNDHVRRFLVDGRLQGDQDVVALTADDRLLARAGPGLLPHLRRTPGQGLLRVRRTVFIAFGALERRDARRPGGSACEARRPCGRGSSIWDIDRRGTIMRSWSRSRSICFLGTTGYGQSPG